MAVQRAHVFPCSERNFRNLCTVFCGQSNMLTKNRTTQVMLVQNPQKIDTAPIFGVSRINAKLWHCSRDLKIGLVSIFRSHTPTGDMSPYYIIKYQTVCEIWALNSHYFIFCMQTRERAKHIPKQHMFCAHTVLDAKYEILGVQRPYCAGNRDQGPLGGKAIGCWHQIK